ncbi:MAG: bifunctional riboflavin kinase/FAD synthetase [Candidatus Aminicenantales bacterium]
MEIFYGLENFPLPASNVALAIGNFDGLHLGHQRILKFLVRDSQKKDRLSLVLTFSPHPERIFRKNALSMIQTLDQRLEGMDRHGVRAVLVVPFDQRFSGLSSLDFIQEVVVRSLRGREVIVGENFHFGRNREGNIQTLRRAGRQFGFSVHSVPSVVRKGKTVSSSLIRTLLKEGKIEEANVFLGKFYSIEGDIIRGDARGKFIGFPTANILTPNEITPCGVYLTLTEVGRIRRASLTNIGTRPTFGREELVIESHILGFDQDIYGERIHLYFLKKLRGERKFKSPEALSLQIHKDLNAAKKYFQNRRHLISAQP